MDAKTLEESNTQHEPRLPPINGGSLFTPTLNPTRPVTQPQNANVLRKHSCEHSRKELTWLESP